MITVLPEKDENVIKEYFNKSGLVFDENSRLVIAKSGEEVLGYCAFRIENETVTVLDLEPKEDILLADGVLRSALHVAAEAFIFKANYDNPDLEKLFTAIDFIKDSREKSLNMDKLFGGCCCGGKDKK